MLKTSAIAAASVAFLGLGSVSAVAETLPPTLAAALEGAELDMADGWAFRKTTRIDAMDEPAVTSVTLWDPSRPEGEQCQVVSIEVSGKAQDQADREEPCQEGHDRQLYGELRKMLDDAVIEAVSEDNTTAVYRLTPREGGRGFRLGGVNVSVDGDDAKRLVGTLTVAKTGPGAPFVDHLEFRLKEPAGNLIAKLRKLDIRFDYGVHEPTGAKLMSGMTVDMDLNLFTLLNVTTEVTTRYDQFRRLE